MARSVAEHLVDLMVRTGVRTVYGMVGDSANPVVDAIRRAGHALTFIQVRNEEAGAFAAGAEAMTAGRPAAVLGSSGPGSLHLLNGLYDCDRNGAPVFAIVTHIPGPEIGTDYFQETQPELIFADCTRYVGYITTPAQVPRLAELAIEAAILERGVGMVILPGDVGVKEVDHPNGGRPLAKIRPKIRPVDADLDRLTDAIAGSSRPMIFGGEGCRDARAEVLQLAQRLHAPVGYTYRGKDVLEADNPNAVGMTGLLGWGGAHRALAECDLLLLLGTDFPYREFLATDATIVQIDDEPAHLGRRAKVALPLVGDVGDTLRCLLPRLSQRDDRVFLDSTLEHHHDAVERIQTYVTHGGSGEGLRPEMVATAISELAADNAVFTNDTGMCNVWGARYLQMKPGQRLIASFRHGSMANAMPQAIGATIGSPNRQVVALCGDGGFSMLMGELLTLGGLGLPVKVMLFNNSTLGMVRIEMAVAGYIPFGTDVRNPDFGALAAAVGIHGERVERAEDVRPAVERAFAHPGPAVIDFVTDPRALSMPPETNIAQVRGMALAMTKLVFAGDSAEVIETIKSNVRNIPQAL
ncbi:MAG TPA: thiamine pyrophosphate-dependent enzyme [Tepidiformaceae bacterium]|nr:thiamine pyrophosphate-dependent enzyme [Tepidiformaceae bacterium]